jgi:hypothetical protein
MVQPLIQPVIKTVTQWLGHSDSGLATRSVTDPESYTVIQPPRPWFSHSFSQWPSYKWLNHSGNDSATHSASDPQLQGDSATHTVIQSLIQPMTQLQVTQTIRSWFSQLPRQLHSDSATQTVTQSISDASLRSDSAAIQTANEPVGTAFNLRRIQAVTLPIREWRSQTQTQTLHFSALASQLQSVTWYVNQSLIHSNQSGSHRVNPWFSYLDSRLISRPFVTWFNYSAISSIDQACIHTSISRGARNIPLLVAKTTITLWWKGRVISHEISFIFYKQSVILEHKQVN